MSDFLCKIQYRMTGSDKWFDRDTYDGKTIRFVSVVQADIFMQHLEHISISDHRITLADTPEGADNRPPEDTRAETLLESTKGLWG